MAALFTVRDALHNVPVRLERPTWYGHVLRNHPEMRNKLDIVKQAIADPDVVLRSHVSAARFSFHRLLPGRRLYVRVVVEFERDDAGDLVGGRVVTAFLTDKLSGGEPVWLTPSLPLR